MDRFASTHEVAELRGHVDSLAKRIRQLETLLGRPPLASPPPASYSPSSSIGSSEQGRPGHDTHGYPHPQPPHPRNVQHPGPDNHGIDQQDPPPPHVNTQTWMFGVGMEPQQHHPGNGNWVETDLSGERVKADPAMSWPGSGHGGSFVNGAGNGSGGGELGTSFAEVGRRFAPR